MELSNLLEHEKNVLHWLDDFGALPKQLVCRLLWDRTERATRKFLSNLVKSRFVRETPDGKLLSLDRNFEMNERVVTALWVLTRFIEKVDSGAFCPGAAPSQVFFVKEGTGYEIVVLEEGEEQSLQRIRLDQDDKCIVVLPNASMMSTITLPSFPVLFATVEITAEAEPNIKFYSMEESDYGENTDCS